MLIIEAKPGGGKRTPYQGDGLFDFGKILLKKALNSNLVKTASKAINSELGQTAIRAVKKAAQSEIGQELQRRAISEVEKKAQDLSNKAFDRINLPESVKRAARSELGQKVQEKLISEVGENTEKLRKKIGVGPTGKRTQNLARATFERLGIAEPPRKRKRKGKGKKGKGFVYPQALLNQFSGNGIILE